MWMNDSSKGASKWSASPSRLHLLQIPRTRTTMSRPLSGQLTVQYGEFCLHWLPQALLQGMGLQACGMWQSCGLEQQTPRLSAAAQRDFQWKARCHAACCSARIGSFGNGGRRIVFLLVQVSANLRVGTMNVRSLSGRLGGVFDLAAKQSIDVVCLQETRVNHDSWTAITMTAKKLGWQTFRGVQNLDSAVSVIGGTLIFSKWPARFVRIPETVQWHSRAMAIKLHRPGQRPSG